MYILPLKTNINNPQKKRYRKEQKLSSVFAGNWFQYLCLIGFMLWPLSYFDHISFAIFNCIILRQRTTKPFFFLILLAALIFLRIRYLYGYFSSVVRASPRQGRGPRFNSNDKSINCLCHKFIVPKWVFFITW